MQEVVFRAGMTAYAARYWLPVVRHAARPERAQADALRRILTANRPTEFGRAHRFADLRTPREFREQVPVQEYETLRGYIERQRCSGVAALTAEPPLFYSQTSGSTGKPKYIPVCASALRIYRAEQALFTYLQYRASPAAFSGKALGIMGAAVETRLDSGHSVGSISGHLYESLPRTVQSRFVVPPSISAIADYDLKYLTILRLALAAPDITYLGSPNPSTFLRLLDILNQRRDELAHSLETGTLPELDALDSNTREVVRRRLRPDSARARQLRITAPLTFATLWPGIRLLTTWTGGSCGIALDKLRATLPRETKVMELGYQSTECRGTIALEAETQGGLPPLHHHFFEFVSQEHWENGRPEFVGLEELEPGPRYYIVITTASGLYRYFMNDLVEVAGRYRNTPLIRFVQKGKGVTNLTGEKLYEAQVIQAVQAAARQRGFVPGFFILVADEETSSYNLLLEADHAMTSSIQEAAADIDRCLGELNVEYHGKRASGRLAPLTISLLREGAGEAYKAACVRAGQREGQFKPAVLQYRRDLALSFGPHVIE
jgi:GH3 auxin-responsive promoter